MAEVKINVMHTGAVCVSPDLPFGGDQCGLIKASGIFQKKTDRVWLPVSAYLIECPQGLILFDTGWSREASPKGAYDKKAQIRSLGSLALYEVNQVWLDRGEAVSEQLESMGIKASDLDYVILSHLDCDHANGLRQVAEAQHILVSREELDFASRSCNRIRYNPAWWQGVDLTPFEWNGTQGPAGKSYDLFGDGSVLLIGIPGHSDGQTALQVFNSAGQFVLLCADGAYADKSWDQMVTSGISADKEAQKASLAWIRDQAGSSKCVAALASHDPGIRAHTLWL